MKTASSLALLLIFMGQLSNADSLHSMNKAQFDQELINKTLISIATDNLNGKTIDNTFSRFMDAHGHVFGKMSIKPENEPQTDQGVYEINDDGTFYIIWQHWDGAKKLCGHVFNTANAYLSVDCNNVFHTAFMKDSVKPGNHL